MSGTPAGRRQHWEQVYQSKGDLDLSWFQKEPTTSLRLIRQFATHDDPVIDVGAGASPLAALLAAEGYQRVAAMDVSLAAIERSRERAGAAGSSIDWLVGDVLGTDTLRGFRLWHDRAVFHFLTDEQERRRYTGVASRALEAGGHLIIAAFAADGPEQCSGLPVHRYDAPSLEREFSPRFAMVHHEREVHVTPWGREQPFTIAVMRRE